MDNKLNQDIILPELGEGVIEGELIKWLVVEGDSITVDQNIAEIMTDKAAMEIPSPFTGIVQSILAKQGDMITVGQSLLTIKLVEPKKQPISDATINPDVSVEDTPVSDDSLSSTADVSVSQNTSLEEKTSSVLATPFIRRLAKQLGINLNQLLGSGLAGRITKLDVLKHQSTLPSKKTPSVAMVEGFTIPKDTLQQRQPLKGIRKKIAQKMQKAKSVIPHFTLGDCANIQPLEELKNTVKQSLQEKNIKVTYLSFIMKTLVPVIKEFPEINASIDDISQEIVIKNYYNFGFAVDTVRGLLVPVIKHVDQKSVAEISLEIQTLAQQARDGSITLENMKQSTFTITNIGSLGGEFATPIINAPEVAILGMYRSYIKPIWDGANFKPQKSMNFSFTCDHRLIDGAVAAKVMKLLIHKIENPLSVFI